MRGFFLAFTLAFANIPSHMALPALLLSVFLAASGATSGSGPAITQPQTGLGDLYARVQQLEEQNRKMQGRTEDLEHKLGQLEDRNRKLQQQLDSVQKATDDAAEKSTTQTEMPKSADVPVKPAVATSPVAPATSMTSTTKQPKVIIENKPALTDKPVAISNTPNDDFDATFNYMQDGNLDQAKTGFNAFVKKYPSSALSGEAYYWLGEMASDEKDYNTAAINYLKGYKEYPKGTKAPENILKLAATLKKLGKNDEACTNLKRFDTEFKTAHANLRAKADRDRQELKCK